jgi:hypothetical protein
MPGDIVIQRDNFLVSFQSTSILLSIVLTVVSISSFVCSINSILVVVGAVEKCRARTPVQETDCRMRNLFVLVKGGSVKIGNGRLCGV